MPNCGSPRERAHMTRWWEEHLRAQGSPYFASWYGSVLCFLAGSVVCPSWRTSVDWPLHSCTRLKYVETERSQGRGHTACPRSLGKFMVKLRFRLVHFTIDSTASCTRSSILLLPMPSRHSRTCRLNHLAVVLRAQVCKNAFFPASATIPQVPVVCQPLLPKALPV